VPAPGGAAELEHGAALLERAVSYARGCLALVGPGPFDAATPCPGWDLCALLQHMDDSLAAFTEAAELGSVRLVGPVASTEPAGAVARLLARACALLAAWTDPPYPTVRVAGHPVHTDLLAGAGALEIAVHGWDVATACGRSRPLPPMLALDLLDLVPVLVDDADRPARFGFPVAVRRSAAPSARLLAAVGRVSPGT